MADTTEKTVAFELRKAATKLRRVANPLPVPWVIDEYGDGVEWVDVDSGERNYVAEGVGDKYAEWIALASPALAEPLASWLEEIARYAANGLEIDDEDGALVHQDDYCGGVYGQDCKCFTAPLAVARVLNGTSS